MRSKASRLQGLNTSTSMQSELCHFHLTTQFRSGNLVYSEGVGVHLLPGYISHKHPHLS
jgi:hypothetical protein